MASTIISKKTLKNGNQSFTANINGRWRKVAEASPWKTGYSINKYTLDGYIGYNSPCVTYDATDLDIMVKSHVEQITDNEAVMSSDL